MELKYHRALFDFIGQSAVVDQKRFARLGIVQQKFGCRFPASIVEFYSINRVTREWYQKLTDDYLLEIEDLGTTGHPDEIAKGFLTVLSTHQYIGICAAKLDIGTDADDPPVFHDCNGPEAASIELSVWTRCQPSFSCFVFNDVARGFVRKGCDAYVATATSNAPNAQDLAMLATQLRSGPSAESGGSTTWHFYQADGYLCVAESSGRADAIWSIHARTKVAFAGLLKIVWPIADLAVSLKLPGTPSHLRGAADILAELRRTR
jgi:hypothetical protein